MLYTFGIAFYHARGRAKNLQASETSKFDVYYRCLSVCFASIRRCYPEARLFLFTDSYLPEPFAEILAAIGVTQEVVAGQYVERTDLWNVFPGCLYTLDVVDHLRSEHGDLLFLLDPDVLMRRPIEDLAGRLEGGKIAAFPIDYDLQHQVQRQSRASLSMLAAHCGSDPQRLPIAYYGGEFYGLPPARAAELSKLIVHVIDHSSIVATKANRLELTEEHVLSVALALLPEVVSASGTIKRIWNVPSYSNWEARDADLPLWHLPGEKNGLFRALYAQVSRIPGMSTEEFDALLSATFKPTPSALLRLAAAGKGRLSATLRALRG